MKDLKKNTEITKLQERASKSSIPLSGFIGSSPNGVVRLFQGSDISQYIDIAESDIDEFDQDSDSGITYLHLKPNAIVDVISTQKVPASRAVFLDNKPDGGVEKTCLQKRIDKCKSDPLVHNKSACDDKTYQNTLQLLCDLFGDPAEGGSRGGLAKLLATNQLSAKANKNRQSATNSDCECTKNSGDVDIVASLVRSILEPHGPYQECYLDCSFEHPSDSLDQNLCFKRCDRRHGTSLALLSQLAGLVKK